MKYLSRFTSFLIHSNLFIASGAVLLAFQTQAELNIPVRIRPFHFLLFFATLFEYNLHRLNTLLFYPESLKDEKYGWMREHPLQFRMICAASAFGLLISLFFMKIEVLVSLLPMAAITIFYSIPVARIKGKTYKLRDIPYLKIFIIAAVWSGVCTILPYIESGSKAETGHLVLLLLMHALLIFAITIPFDIRDSKSDAAGGLKTLAHIGTEKNAYRISTMLIILMCIFAFIYSILQGNFFELTAYTLSTLYCLSILHTKRLKKHRFYYHGFLDSCMHIQSMLILLIHFL